LISTPKRLKFQRFLIDLTDSEREDASPTRKNDTKSKPGRHRDETDRARLASLERPEGSSAKGCSMLKIALVAGSMIFPAGCGAVGKTEQG
jgi:hypothetical protein